MISKIQTVVRSNAKILLRFPLENHIMSKPFKDCKATLVALTLSGQNLPTDRARDMFKPSDEAQSLLAST